MQVVLLVSIFAVGTCGIVYELIAGTVASYLLGDSVTQFSTVIGAYLTAMGLGAFLSRYLAGNLAAAFVQIELLVGLVGGFLAAALFLSFDSVASFRIVLYGLVGAVGILVGVELPLLMRLLREKLEMRELVARAFTADYVGAFAASVLFPLVLVPFLGLVRSSFLFGAVNIVVALWALAVFGPRLPWRRLLAIEGAAFLGALAAGFVLSDRILAVAEGDQYPDTVIYAKSTPYQRVVLTRSAGDVRLFLNGNLQFSSQDEHRYHEALVHPAASAVRPSNVLILGGGDGFAARELLRYPSVERLTLVDLDPSVTRLFHERDDLAALNGRSLQSPKLKIVHADAFAYLSSPRGPFDLVVVDLPDPSSFSLGKLYTTAFYRRLSAALAPHGAAAIQCTSPTVAPRSFWCVVGTLEAAGFSAVPYHAYVPSFGDWGFVAAFRGRVRPAGELPPGLRFLDRETLASLGHFPPDAARVPVGVNRLDNQLLVRLFEDEWSRVQR